MTDLAIKILTAVSKRGGASAREIRDCLNGPQRKDIKTARDALVRAGQMFCATNRFPGNPRASVRYFATVASADAWAAQEGELAKSVAPAATLFTKRTRSQTLRADTPVAPHSIKPHGPPAGYDYRYTVRSLPAGYVSVINTAECSAWALVVSERT